MIFRHESGGKALEIIKSDKLSIVPLQLNNVYDLRNWDKYKDPLFDDYNFPELDDSEVRDWYRSRVSESSSKSFAVLLEEKETIGLINIKNIRRLLKVANLGIVFNPKYIDKGYGTTALKSILRYYFETMDMRSLYLDVAVHNKRAIRCYEKCGFKKIKKHAIKSIEILEEEISYGYTEEDFVIKDGIVYLYHYKMRLGKKNYEDFA